MPIKEFGRISTDLLYGLPMRRPFQRRKSKFMFNNTFYALFAQSA